MKIGYCVEGATDRAVIRGLQRRWCPDAQLIEGSFRGSTQLGLRREIPKICDELDSKGCDIIVLLTDSNAMPHQEVGRAQRQRVPNKFQSRVLSGVAARNIESWLCCDRDWIASMTSRQPAEFAQEDPKAVLETALGISATERREDHIATLVFEAPLKQWIARSPSFESFYEAARDLSQSALGRSLGCAIPNEREKSSKTN